MFKNSASRIALFISALLVSLILGETAVRVLGHFDGDGDFFVGKTRVYPCQWPGKALAKKINESLSPRGLFSHYRYDPFLGWAPRPYSVATNGLYFFNDAAIRKAAKEIPTVQSPATGVLRIALFGDSFTHGDEVRFQETWGYYLEEYLNQAGIRAEVLNFGVGGYGLDQAFLRWRTEGRAYKPHIVILGLQTQDLHRNANLIWAIYANRMGFEGPGIPFSKPRFILEKEELKLINSPTPPPQEFLKIMQSMDTFKAWEFSGYERWFNPKIYQTNFFFQSKLCAFIYSFFTDSFSREQQEIYAEEFKPLGLKIIREFKNDVEKEGGQFYAVYLPFREEVKYLSEGRGTPAESILKAAENHMPLIDPSSLFLAEIKKRGDGRRALSELFARSHYSSEGNKIIADTVSGYIVKKEIKQKRIGIDRL